MRTLTAAQTQVLSLPGYRSCVRVQVDRGDGMMVDLSDFFAGNWLKSVKWWETMDDQCGKFTITLVRESYYNSLAPLVTGSQLNQQTGSYLPLLDVGRKIEIDTAVIPLDAEPQSSDWIVSFQGYIDTVDPGKVDFEIELDGRDLGGRVADRVAEGTVIGLGSGSQELLETSMQNDVINGIFTPVFTQSGDGETQGQVDPSAPTLYTPSSPDWMLATQYAMQPGQGCADQCQQMAAQIGWDVRYLWDNGTSAFRFTLWEPQRNPTAVAETFTPSQIRAEVQQMETDLSWVRNVVMVSYGQTTPPSGQVPGGAYPQPFQPIVVESPTSIKRYGRRFCAIGLDASGNILDATHASSLANSVLADLEEPILVSQIPLQFRPEAMLGDYYEFGAPTPWWDTPQRFAVYGIQHEFDWPGEDGNQADAKTTLTVRGYPAISKDKWHESMACKGVCPPPKNQNPDTPTITGTTSDIRGLTVQFTTPSLYLFDWHETQLHLSTVSGFTPSAATMVDRGRRASLLARGLAPGTTYYARVIHFDKQGNQTQSAQATIAADSVHMGDLGSDLTINFRAHVQTTFSIGSTSPKTIIFDTVDWDLESDYSNTTGKFTAPAAGYYRFAAQLVLAGLSTTSAASGYLSLHLSTGQLIPGQFAKPITDPASPSTARLTAYVEASVHLAQNETVEVDFLWQGSDLNGLDVALNVTWFEGQVMLS